MTPLNADYLHRLSDLIAERTGLNTYEHRRERLVEILHQYPEAMFQPANFLERLWHLPDEHPMWQALLAELTIGETYFLRDEAQIAALRNHILPQIIQEKRRQKEYILRLWSAGCATGEEPYTLAILLVDLLPDLSRWHIEIVGTDINEAALEIARVGRYRDWSLRGTAEITRQRFFTRVEELGLSRLPIYELLPELRAMVKFRHGNLLEDENLPQDLVVCRNVLMYFTPAQREKMEYRLLQSIRSGGWLILSSVETLTQTRGQYTTQHFNGSLAYQKASNVADKIKLPVPRYAAPSLVLPEEIAPAVEVQNGENRYRVAVTAMQAGRLELAMRLAQQSLTDTPRSPAVHSLIASILASWGDADQATTHLRQALEMDVLYADAHYLLALMQMEMGDYQSARSSLRAAIYCRPDFSLAYLVSGDLFKQADDFSRAAHAWETARRFAAALPATFPLSDVADVTAEQLIRLVDSRLATAS